MKFINAIVAIGSALKLIAPMVSDMLQAYRDRTAEIRMRSKLIEKRTRLSAVLAKQKESGDTDEIERIINSLGR